MPSAELSELVDRATHHAERTHRDDAFRALLAASPSAPAAVQQALEGTQGIVERSDRVAQLAAEVPASAPLLDLMGRVACDDPSRFVRLEACRRLIEAGPTAEPLLLAALDAALSRGERPERPAGSDGITPIVQALCLSGGPALLQLIERVVGGVPLPVGMLLVDLLVETGRLTALETLAVRTAVPEPADESDAGDWAPLRLHLAEALLSHGRATPDLLLAVACSAPITRLRLQALDALTEPPAAALDALAPLVEARDGALSRAAGRAWARMGAAGLEALRGVAEAELPAPSAAWWVLAELEPAWCAARVCALENTTGMALLTGQGSRPPGARLLHAVARSQAGMRLRTAATRRLLALGAVGRRESVSLWLYTRGLCPPTDGSGASADHAVARLVGDVPHDLLACSPGLVDSLDAVLSGFVPARVDALAASLCAVAHPEADPPEGAFAGLLYHPDAPERLQAGVGLCQRPVASMLPALVQRATDESDPLVRRWLAAAAWLAVRATPTSTPPSDALVGRLVRVDAGLAEALRAPAPVPVDARDAQLAEWLALEPAARVEALIALSRSHRGRNLTRIQARDLSRALAQPGRARHVVGLLLSPDKPGALGRALVIARRAGAGRSRRHEAAALDLEEGMLDPEPMVEPTDDSASDELSEDSYSTGGPYDWPEVHDHPQRPLLPRAARARVVAPIRPDIAVALERLELLTDDPVQELQHVPHDATLLHETLPTRSLETLQKELDVGPMLRWAALFPDQSPYCWPEDRPVVLTDPTTLAAITIVRDAMGWNWEVAEDCAPFGRRCAAALDALLCEEPPAEPALSHLAQLLHTFGQAFPAHTSRLVRSQGAHHPQWRPLLYAAWLAERTRLSGHDHPQGLPTASEVQHLVARSVLAVTRAARVSPLQEVGPQVRSVREHRPWNRRLLPVREQRSSPTRAERLFDVAPVLAAGAFSTDRLDYPSFRVSARKGFARALQDLGLQERVSAHLAIVALFHRIAAYGCPADLLRLAWRRAARVEYVRFSFPLVHDPVDDPGLRERAPDWAYALYDDDDFELPPVDDDDFDLPPPLDDDFDLPPPDDGDFDLPPPLDDDFGLPPSDAGDDVPPEPPLTIDEWSALAPDHPRRIVQPMPPEHRRPALAILYQMFHANEQAIPDVEPPSWWASADRDSVLQQVIDDARAYVVLRAERPGRARIARKTLRRFWRRADAVAVPTLAALRDVYGADRVVEGLVQGLLVHLVDGPPASSTARAADKQVAIRTLRQLGMAWNFSEPATLTESSAERAARQASGALEFGWMTDEEVHAALRTLHRTVEVVPRELAVALGLSDAQGLPTLLGGARTALERSFLELVSELAPVLSARNDVSAPATTFELRPLTKSEAVLRGDRAGDCSSSSVPFRCMSPHHNYYGVYLNGEEKRGYLTLFEAWLPGDDGTLTPTLVLETINIPIPLFDFIQLDLVHIAEAIAHHRGLSPRIAMVTEWWAWNYPNRRILRQSRMARRGEPVCLLPADPWCWSIYQLLMPEESNTYSPFQRTPTAIRLLPTDPSLDHLQPENVAEAARIRALPRRSIVPTAWEGDAVIGFISALPDTP